MLKHALGTIALADVLSNQRIAQPLREWAGIEHDLDGNKIGYDDTSFLSSMLWCVYCTSFWTSGGLLVLKYVSPKLYDIAVLWLGGAFIGRKLL